MTVHILSIYMNLDTEIAPVMFESPVDRKMDFELLTSSGFDVLGD